MPWANGLWEMVSCPTIATYYLQQRTTLGMGYTGKEIFQCNYELNEKKIHCVSRKPRTMKLGESTIKLQEEILQNWGQYWAQATLMDRTSKYKNFSLHVDV